MADAHSNDTELFVVLDLGPNSASVVVVVLNGKSRPHVRKRQEEAARAART